MTEFERMIRLLDTSWPMRSEIVPCLVGPPGIGKTAAVKQHARAHGCGKVVKIVASRCVPSETVGMTMPDHANRSMSIYNSMQLSSLEDGDVLFFDELLEADQFVLSTLLTVIESREMADGTPLPDIQIIAATNDTIPPDQLKGNIRQRFMFMTFKVDRNQTRKYIQEQTGIWVPDSVIAKIVDDGSGYNFLTPRSLTKLCLWMNAVDEEKAPEVADVINDIWGSNIGTELMLARKARDAKIPTPEEQLRSVVKTDIGIDAFAEDAPDFDDCTMTEMLEYLQSLPDWDEIKGKLEHTLIATAEEDETQIKF